MQNQSNQERIRNLYQMLFEMATGNLSFRIENSKKDDQLDELAKILNALARGMQAALKEFGYVNPHYTYQNLVQSTFILDDNYCIKSFSANVTAILSYTPEELFNYSFKKIIADQSVAYWELIAEDISTNQNYHHTIQFIFISRNKKLIPSFCTISRLLYSDKIIISTVTTILQDILSDIQENFKNIAPRISDTVLIQNVHDYILKHLEEPLPTVRELSKIFGTNEFRLKDGFRHFFNTSIYQFYIEEKLKRAHLLIQQTDKPLKVIALMSGFNDYTNFYKAFKKRFAYSPSDLQRQPDQE